MTTLITGAGLVGSLAAARLIAERGEHPVLYDVAFSMENLVERLPLEQVTLVRGDVTDFPDLARVVQDHHVDRIIHTAGMLTWMVRQRPYAGVRVNLLGTLSVLEAARLSGVRRVVFCSSYSVYRGLKEPPVDRTFHEDFALRSVSDYPPSVYSSMKLAAEWLGHCYRNEYGVDFVAVRFGGVFGPWRGSPGAGPGQLMQRLVESAFYQKPCRISSGDLEYARSDYIYACDAAQGAVRAAFAPSPDSRVYNIAMGQVSTVRDIVAALEHITHRKMDLDVYHGGSHSGYDQEIFPSDTSLARAELGWELEYPMETALRDYLAWLGRGAA